MERKGRDFTGQRKSPVPKSWANREDVEYVSVEMGVMVPPPEDRGNEAQSWKFPISEPPTDLKSEPVLVT